MKQIKTIIAALLIITAASSCSKNNDIVAPPAATGPRLSKIEYPATNYVQTFTYNTNGRLVNVSDGYFTMKYDYSSSLFGYEVFNASNTKQTDLTNVVFSANKLISFDDRFYNSNGDLSSTDPTTVQYDANGYQTGKSYSGYVYTNTISNGNTVHTTQTNTVTGFTRNITLDYYTDKPNKLNINLFENWFQDQYLCDRDILGKKNANLPKKYVYSSSTYNQVSELTYVLNADGLPTQITVINTTNGGAPTTGVYNLSYQ
jgi:hypothetical protein